MPNTDENDDTEKIAEAVVEAVANAVLSLQEVNNDPDEWYKIYLQPIDNTRSFTISTAVTDTNPENQDTPTSSTRQESRCHAFYRIIGFPVAIPNGGYYNPGYDPDFNKEQKKNIDAAFDHKATMLREKYPIEMSNIFSKLGDEASIFYLAQRFPRKFQVIKEGMKPFDNDLQSEDIQDRKNEINNFYDNKININEDFKADAKQSIRNYFSDKSPGSNLTSWKHYLKPFITNPLVVALVNPPERIIAAPFLVNTNSATMIRKDPPINLFRPKLEDIIRQRLADSQDKTFLFNVERILNNDKSVPDSNLNDIIYGDLRSLVIELADTKQISPEDLKETFSELTAIQALRISLFTKLIKLAVNLLHTSIVKIESSMSKFNFVPDPDPEGPEYTRKITLRDSGVACTTDLDNQIVTAELNKFEAEYCSENTKNSSNFNLRFHTPTFGTTNKTDEQNFAQKFEELKKQRDNHADIAKTAYRNIELIMGEVGGLGLIDIFAIYAALWTIDEKSLIYFLDDNAFTRLWGYNPELYNARIMDRINSIDPQTIMETLEKFEKILIYFLTFADEEFKLQKKNPLSTNSEGSVA